jgi:hypothetical protein
MPNRCAATCENFINLPLTTCIDCQNTQDPTKCYECADKVNTQRKLTLHDRVRGKTDADCCAQLTPLSAPSSGVYTKAVACLAEDTMCASCITERNLVDKLFDMGSCIDCVNRGSSQPVHKVGWPCVHAWTVLSTS